MGTAPAPEKILPDHPVEADYQITSVLGDDPGRQQRERQQASGPRPPNIGQRMPEGAARRWNGELPAKKVHLIAPIP